MKYLVTGGASGLGEYLCRHHSGAESVSRRNGYDICSDRSRQNIAKRSLEFDVFVNNAFDGPPQEDWANLAQVKMLRDVYALWRERKKRGHIINIGSIASAFPIHEYSSFQTFRIAKVALDEASLACTSAFLNNQVPFKTSLVRVGRLDTELARSRESWTGNALELEYVSRIIDNLVASPRNACPFQVDVDVNLQFETTI